MPRLRQLLGVRSTPPLIRGGWEGFLLSLLLLFTLPLFAADNTPGKTFDPRQQQPENPKPIRDAPSLRIPAAPAYKTTLKELGYQDADDLLKQTLQAQSRVWSVAFDGGGQLASGSSDGTVKLWDKASQQRGGAVTLLAVHHGMWLKLDAAGSVTLADDDSLLRKGTPLKSGTRWEPVPIPANSSPWSAQPEHKELEVSAGKASLFTFILSNAGTQPVHRPQIVTNVTSTEGLRIIPAEPQPAFPQAEAVFSRSSLIPPGGSIRLAARVMLAGSTPLPSGVYTLPVTVNAGGQSQQFDLKVTVKAPNLNVTGSDFSSANNTLNIDLKNEGTAALPKTDFYLADPEGKLDLPRQSLDAIAPQAETALAFTLPANMPSEQRNRLQLEIRPMRPPLYTQWLIPLEIKVMPLYQQLLLTLLAAGLLGFTIFYFRRYRHPLVLELGETPQALLRLPPEQLPEAQQRLSQTRRLDKVLSDAAVSPQTLQAAIGFQQLDPAEKAELLEKRLGAKILPIPPFAKEGTLQPEAQGADSTVSPFEKGGTRGIFFLHLPPDFPLNVDKLLLFFPEKLAAEDAFTHLKNIPAAQSRITLILGNDSAYQRKLYNTTRDPSNKWVAPQGGELTRLLLVPDADTALAEILAGQLALQQISPYQTGGGVYNESVFFGRRELIAQIINRDPANYLLVGGRQVGKSTLLKAIERRYADNPQVQCHYLTLSSEVLVPRLAALLKLDKTDNPETLAAQLDEHIRQTGQRYVFLIDEADRFIADEKAHDYRILNVFRRLSEEGRCNFILAGFWQLYQHAVLDYQSPIRNFGELLSIGALEKPACRELAVQPMQTMNLAYANDALVGHLVDSCGQRANLIAIACQHIVRNLPPQSRTIEAGDVDKALRSDELRRALSGWSVGEADREQAYERLIVYATIGEESFTTADLLQLARQHGLNVDTQELDRTLSRLELAFIIGRESGRWFYRVPLFVDYIREDAPAEKLAAEWQRFTAS